MLALCKHALSLWLLTMDHGMTIDDNQQCWEYEGHRGTSHGRTVIHATACTNCQLLRAQDCSETCLAQQVLLQNVYHTQAGVTCLILKLAADIVEAHISFAQVSPACRAMS